MGTRLIGGVVATVVALLPQGCAGSAEPAARDAARAFGDALAAEDAAAVCDLLTASAREDAAGQRASCEAAVLELVDPGSGPLLVESAGEAAVAHQGAQTYFLARVPVGWRVVAAGCVPRGTAYDCEVDGS